MNFLQIGGSDVPGGRKWGENLENDKIFQIYYNTYLVIWVLNFLS